MATVRELTASEPYIQMLAYAVRLALALLVALMAASEWRRTRREGLGHLAIAFALVVLQQGLLVAHSLQQALAGEPVTNRFTPVIQQGLAAGFLILLVHALAVHDDERRAALRNVTRLLLQANLLAYALVQFAWFQAAGKGGTPDFALFWGEHFYALWNTGLLLLSIYLAVVLEADIKVLPALLVLLVGEGAHLLNVLIWNNQIFWLRLTDLTLPVVAFLLFLAAAHIGIVQETQTDALTGMGNRRYFLARVQQVFERARRRGRPLAVLVLDLDHFKRYNDTYGHLAGDELLQDVARQIAKHLRNGDMLSRWGGEEFIVLLPGAARDQAVMVAERLRRAVATLEPAGGRGGSITVSIGAATYPESAATWEELVDRADRTLYEAKRFRNRVAVYAPEVAAEIE